jgi:N-acetylneuraminic acid mutarotase
MTADEPALSPSKRGYVSMAYDSESDRVILYGGQIGNNPRDPSSFSGATWGYDVAANTWTQMEPASGPGKRSAVALAYDSESDRVILFGGANADTWYLYDTWAYDHNTNTWTQMAPGPKNHLGPRIAYDAESDRVILFGGYNGFVVLDDTWAYDFNSDSWTEMKPTVGPPGRNYQGITYDSKADRVLVWGAVDWGDGTPIDDSMWAYDFNTNTWTEIKPGDGPHPEGRDYTAMAYDAESDRTILYGGTPQGSPGTWVYDYNTNTWTNMPVSGNPGNILKHAMAYSTNADRVILFGGQRGKVNFLYSGNTWIYDLNSNTWTNVTPDS